MKRRVFSLLAGISALIFVMTAVLWTRSLWRSDGFHYTRGLIVLTITSNDGELWLEWKRYPPKFPPQKGNEIGQSMPDGFSSVHQFSDAVENSAEAELWNDYVLLAFTTKPDRTGWNWRQLGFGEAGFRGVHPQSQLPNLMRLYLIPYWFLIVIAGILPMRWGILRQRASSRRRNQACLHCGYDIRATPGRCPECGMISSSAETGSS